MIKKKIVKSKKVVNKRKPIKKVIATSKEDSKKGGEGGEWSEKYIDNGKDLVRVGKTVILDDEGFSWVEVDFDDFMKKHGENGMKYMTLSENGDTRIFVKRDDI